MTDSIKRHKILILLLLIVFLAGIIRFYKVTEYPVSLYWDEVSIAINANFIAETGKDEYGNNFPLIFKAFNDYKSPGNIYLTAIPVKVFGLNEFSARFISAFLGTLLVIVMFFLGKNITFLAKKNINIEYFGLLSAFLLAISPWHIQFSRSGFEANSGLFFVTLATTLFLIFLNKNKFKFFFLSSFFFGISCYFYRSDFIFAPLFFAFLLVINFRTFIERKNIGKSLLGIIIFVLVLAPFIPPMLSSEGMSRGNRVSILNPDNSFNKVVESSQKLEESDRDTISKIIYNRRVAYGELFLENYASYFKYNFLFRYGDSIERHDVLGMGQFYLWQLPFFLIGVLSAFFVRKKVTAIILSWLILAAVPAALSVPDSHALRSLNMLPAYLIVISSGIFLFYNFIPKKTYWIASLILAVIVSVSFVHYVSLYKKSAILYSEAWADGYKQLFGFVNENKNNYGKIVISGHYWQPYAYGLFYTGYDPRTYLENGSRTGFDKFSFGGTSWEKEEELSPGILNEYSRNKNILFALSPEEFMTFRKNLNTVKIIKNHNNEIVFIITRPK